MTNNRKSKKRMLGITLALAAVLILAATFAWFTSTDKVENKFKTGALPDGSVKIVEDFPDEPLMPGIAVKKEVGVLSNSNVPVLVRLTFDEALQKMIADGNVLEQTLLDAKSTDSKHVPVPAIDYASAGYSDPTTLAGTGITSVEGVPAGLTLLGKKTIGDQYELAIFREEDGKFFKNTAEFELENGVLTVSNIKYAYYTRGTENTVAWTVARPAAADTVKSQLDDKILLGYSADVNAAQPEADKWAYEPETGYFYFIGKLAPGAMTPEILTTVKLDGSADNTYQLMDYQLDVKIEALQATKEAVEDGGFAGMSDAIKAALLAVL
ncbi:SipW-dependent-type signal peptide-containing protein [Vagococcus acidifermentans]|uniref:Alternate signal-mediated exported protein n=1 Tax=Vagococcus acidifermentans TaxID=564710 RepID=A0A430B309_9ENTE|nr:SipW-dependent-type signal peptide-containing protein [Vagococcus acidifermentans]RSU14611.1 hypothetical protein CBF27_01105 [Vagococcus acidifermentans]